MARQRQPLSEKQERILIQCQLMGLTTGDMIQISNRLKALEVERELIKEIDEVKQGCTWTKTASGWIIHAADGRSYDCKPTSNKRARRTNFWDTSLGDWDVHISKPSTRFKPKTITGSTLYGVDNVKKSLCPEGSKELFHLLRQIYKGRWN